MSGPVGTRMSFLGPERERSCAWCGKAFTTRTGNTLYCCDGCRRAAGKAKLDAERGVGGSKDNHG